MILNHACPSFAQAVKRDAPPLRNRSLPTPLARLPHRNTPAKLVKIPVPQYICALFNAAQQHNIATRHDLIIATRHATSLLEPRGF